MRKGAGAQLINGFQPVVKVGGFYVFIVRPGCLSDEKMAGAACKIFRVRRRYGCRDAAES